MTLDPKYILQKYWGYQNFRSPQGEIIASIINKNDTVALLPTGGGKSVCFQIPAIIAEGKTLVVSPLIALMQDQVTNLKKRAIKAECLHASLKPHEIIHIFDNFEFGDLKLLYISPERIRSELFQMRIRNIKIDIIAVDEAHCISQWGYDFRPAYFDIHVLRDMHPNATMVALTATATRKVIEDIIFRLEIKTNHKVFRKSFARENLSITSLRTSNKREEIIQILNKIKGSAIVYVRNRQQTIDMSNWLISHGFSCASYHGGMDKTLRDRNQDQWMSGAVQTIVATNAFGMGIDKPDVRVVIHLDIPPSIEEYYQEAGRAGRDGKNAYAIIITDTKDDIEARANHEDQYPDFGFISMIYDGLCRYYNIPFGSGRDETYNYDASDFALFIKQPAKKVYHAVSLLEKESWVALSDAFFEASRIQVLTNHEDLLGLQQIGHKYYPILVHLLRKYEGLFTVMVKIDENRISKELQMPKEMVIRLLKQMHVEGLISYAEQTAKPQMTFLLDRPEIKSFSIDHYAYEERRLRALQRLESMIEFIQEEKICRQFFITKYFGETGKDCGKCDICLGSGSTALDDTKVKEIFVHLSKTVKNGPYSLKKYIAMYPFYYRKKILNLLEQWQFEDIIFINTKGEIVLHHSA